MSEEDESSSGYPPGETEASSPSDSSESEQEAAGQHPQGQQQPQQPVSGRQQTNQRQQSRGQPNYRGQGAQNQGYQQPRKQTGRSFGQQSGQPVQRPSQPQTSNLYEDVSSGSFGKKLCLAGGVLAAIGVVLPWVSVSTFGIDQTLTGLDITGGRVTILISLLVVAVIAQSRAGYWGKWSWYGTLGLGLFALLMTFPVLLDGEVNAAGESVSANPEIGIFFSALGVVMMTAGPLYDRFAGDDQWPVVDV